MNSASEKKKQDLDTAYEVHHFYREADETIGWISEKQNILATNNVGKDLAGVVSLQRKHEVLDRDLAALSKMVSQSIYLLPFFKFCWVKSS